MRAVQTELLAPAGSYESMKAAVSAGADAVYIGGSRFGARAYADNLGEEEMLRAIDYAHLYGVSLYMTVNTLVKEKELSDLFDYLNPYYKQGLDGVIVQDLGVLSYIQEAFPKLPIHASTQMTITGAYGAKMLKRMGVKRVVPARELSLEEIERIHEQVDIEIESFVHGALCYCYSGQCLLSSLIGGRSGNRGRCAQPCRLPYDVMKNGRSCLPKDQRYVMSLKDLCTLDSLPQLLEAGICSLKIEGRMKSPRYTAGVVSIYRKYVDLYKKYGVREYRVDEKDKKILLDLFDRGGLTDGYYKQHNGKDMIALGEKPAFRQGNQELFDYLDKTYVNRDLKEDITGILMVKEGQEVRLTLEKKRGEKDYVVEVEGPKVQTALNQPLTEEGLRRQMEKTGNTPFQFKSLKTDIEGNGFLPVQALNELRRKGLKKLQAQLLAPYQRENGFRPGKSSEKENGQGEMKLHALVSDTSQFFCVLRQKEVSEIEIESDLCEPENWKQMVKDCHGAGKRCVLAMPFIFRSMAEQFFNTNARFWKEAGFDGILVRSLEEVEYLKEQKAAVPLYGDHTLYCFNKRAATILRDLGLKRMTLPLELNSVELEQVGCEEFELVSYGFLPVMISAQCIQKTTGTCTGKEQILYMRDRTGKDLMVKNHCRFCYNTIYNPSPLSLLDQEKLIRRLGPEALRLQFTREQEETTEAVIQSFAESFVHGKIIKPLNMDFTRGHFKRGVE
jgi:putative protease